MQLHDKPLNNDCTIKKLTQIVLNQKLFNFQLNPLVWFRSFSLGLNNSTLDPIYQQRFWGIHSKQV